GNSKVMEYYNRNKESVRRIMRFDFLDLQYRLPRRLLQIPYDIMNRLNRRKLLTSNTGLVNTITTDDFFLSSYTDEALDLYLVAQK
ncbi:MAG TPA: SAM-dependent methyltransferase, partial [Bacteroidales bacterium]|nr:SAM-dependent methyltransferase [Bacteroidales bacterium]